MCMGLGHITKIAATLIYVVKSFESLLLRTERPMTLKLGMQDWGLRSYQINPNDGPRLICT